MNNKGQVMFYAFMIGLVIIVLALALAPVVKEQVDTTRNTDNLNCTNPDINNYDKAACYVADLTIFHFVGGLIFIAGMVIGAKIFLG